jgi:hypothetical protein
VAFCDGRAEAWRNRYSTNYEGAENVTATTGFLSADNSVYDLE